MQDNQLFRWVKASERLPEPIPDKRWELYFVQTEGNNKKDLAAFDFDTKKWETGFGSRDIDDIRRKQYKVTEWLEPLPQVGKEGEDEKDAAYKALSDQLEFLAGKIINRDKEIERLKGLIEKAYDAGYADYDDAIAVIRNNWPQFKSINNL